MDILVHQMPAPDTENLRDHAQSRMRQVLRRMGRFVQKGVIRLTDLNGPRGGMDKACQIQLVVAGQTPVIVSAQALNWHGALESALDRAAHTLRRQIGQRKRR
jgi:hypothetical protein